jgi:hypothetical protein
MERAEMTPAMREHTLTAGQLIAVLAGFPDDTPVFVSGEFIQCVSGVEWAHVRFDPTSLSEWHEEDGGKEEKNAVIIREIVFPAMIDHILAEGE